ncbi:MAG: hypothetical protein CMN30_16465 [Sandaracinus sp.]|nr:hypothetical protein [Sandaracinus sp.]|tara:strand:+ start:264 stop:677 length:414 start_codon:yes stop_codon:yes gene_type:complete
MSTATLSADPSSPATSSKAKLAAYWITTALVAAAFLLGGFADITGAEPVLESMERLGYPVYFGVILGVWKLLGALAIVAPGTGRLKEWAYAGIAFDLTGAAASHAFAGDPAGEAVPALVLLVLAAASYALRPTSRRL